MVSYLDQSKLAAGPLIQVVIGTHRGGPLLKRAVESVLEFPQAAVIVVAHGLPAEALGVEPGERVQVLTTKDRLGKPGHPMNLGVQKARAPYVSILGSDDFYEPGTLANLLDTIRKDGADVVLAPLKVGGRTLPTPNTWRTKRLKAVRDGLFDRSAPLGLFKRSVLANERYQLREDLETGEDLQTTIRMWSDGLRISYNPLAGGYVIGQDSPDRVTGQKRTGTDRLRAVQLLLDEGEISELPNREQRALIAKILRTQIMNPVIAAVEETEGGVGIPASFDLEEYTRIARQLHALQPQVAEIFTSADRNFLAALLKGDPGTVKSSVVSRTQAPLVQRVKPPKTRMVFAPEANMRGALVRSITQSKNNLNALLQGKREQKQQGSGRKPQLLLISFSHITRDARVLKQIETLKETWQITTCGFGQVPSGVANHIPLPEEAHSLRLDGRIITAKQYRLAYWNVAAVKAAWDKLAGRKFDAVLANEVDSVPLAQRLGPRWGVLADLHEYYPALHEDDPLWEKRIKPYYEWLCRTYLPKTSCQTTVSPGVATKYQMLAGIHPKIVTNAAPQAHLEPTAVNEPLAFVHHGAALRGRQLDRLIEIVEQLKAPTTLDLYLMPNDPAYLRELQQKTAQSSKVRVLPGIPQGEIISTLNRYDVGFYLLPPTTDNHRYALPNKFFDFVQARLGVVVGGSHEMAALTKEHGLGITIDNHEAAPETLESITSGQVKTWKQNAHKAAAELSAEHEVGTWGKCLEEMRRGLGR